MIEPVQLDRRIAYTQVLVVLSKQWFGEKDRAIEAPIHEACGFQLLNSMRV